MCLAKSAPQRRRESSSSRSSGVTCCGRKRCRCVGCSAATRAYSRRGRCLGCTPASTSSMASEVDSAANARSVLPAATAAPTNLLSSCSIACLGFRGRRLF
ncbi:PP150 [Orf virus]|uniref:PP150 n=1 Tax=Orf virus TaxID=10258 RepID=F1AWW6_ORFV|nr:PP150 [Orf virus]